MDFFGSLAPAVIAAVITSCAALGAALFAFVSAIINARVSRRNALIQARMLQALKLAEFRQSWINGLRDCLVDAQAMIAAKKEFSFHRFALNAARIQLMINPEEEKSRELIQSIGSILDNVSDDADGKVSAQNHDRFRKAAQAILKYEWNVLKSDLDAVQ